MPEENQAPATKADIQLVLQAVGGFDKRFTGLDQRFNGLDQRFTDLNQRITDLDQRITDLDQRITDVEQRLNERIHDTETKLLSAFHGWARPQEIRMRNLSTMVSGFEERLGLVEERISRLERGDKPPRLLSPRPPKLVSLCALPSFRDHGSSATQ
jgi:predicted  nucleic acid-binding Zn-ribbon protein